MPRRILFYVSGHGLGHAVRSAEIVRALAAMGDVAEIHVRTSAPAHPFAGIAGAPVRLYRSDIDAGAVEASPLAVDAERTLEGVAAVLARRDEIVAREIDFVRREGISVIASDAPFLAGEVAAAAGVPCFAVTNFTWDWIYEPLSRAAGTLDAVRDGYRKMAGWLRLPFHHPSELFPSVVDVPLVARHPRHTPEQVLAALGLDPNDSRPRVLNAMRGGIEPDVLRSAASGSPGLLFLDLGEPHEPPVANLRSVSAPNGMTFTDLLGVCSAAVSKLGYGTVSECIATGVALLSVPRLGFREEQLLRRDASRYLRQGEIPAADYRAGRWGEYLERLLAAPPPAERMRTDGAAVCAGLLAAA